MAKGSLFWGQGRGKLGQVVLSTVKGQQIARTYQATVANPKSTGQMEQRAKFANAVKFFKRSQQNLFKFAYEDKKKTESDYNAFMRHNVSVSCFLKKPQVDNVKYPALGMVDRTLVNSNPTWMLAQGSLPEILLPATGGIPKLSLNIDEGKTADNVTVADFSSGIMGAYPDLLPGDFVTLVTIISNLSGVDVEPTEAPIWGIVQVKVDASDTTPLKELFSMQAENNTKGQPSIAVAETILSLSAPSTPAYACTMFAAIASRKTASGLLTSNSYLHVNQALKDIISETYPYDYRKAAFESWSAKQVILEGSIADSVG